MPNQPKTPARAVRLDEDLWERAAAVAERDGSSRSEVVRKALEQYLRRRERNA